MCTILNKLPSYIIDPKLIYLNKTNIIIDTIFDLCCDEYFCYLEEIPKDYILKLNKLDKFICVSALNGSQKCFEYLISLEETKYKSLNKVSVYISILESACKGNQTDFIIWYLNNDIFIDNIIKPKLLITKYKKGITPSMNVAYDLLNHTLYWTIHHDNFEIFKELEKIIIIEKCLYSILKSIIKENKNNFFDYIIEKYNNSLVCSELKKIFLEPVIIHDNILFNKIYELIRSQIVSKDIDRFIISNINNLNIIKRFEIHLVNNKKLTFNIFDKLSQNTTHLGNNTNYEQLIKIYLYLFDIIKPEKDELRKFYDIVSSRHRSKICRFICEHLINNGLEIENFREMYYDYYMIKKRIDQKKSWNNKKYFLEEQLLL